MKVNWKCTICAEPCTATLDSDEHPSKNGYCSKGRERWRKTGIEDSQERKFIRELSKSQEFDLNVITSCIPNTKMVDTANEKRLTVQFEQELYFILGRDIMSLGGERMVCTAQDFVKYIKNHNRPYADIQSASRRRHHLGGNA